MALEKSIIRVIDKYEKAREERFQKVVDFQNGKLPYIINVTGPVESHFDNCNTIDSSFNANISDFNKALDIVSGRTVEFTRRGLLLFGSRLSLHGIAAITFLRIVKHDSRIGIFGYSFFRTRKSAGGIFTMMAVILHEKRRSFQNLDYSGADRKPMFLFTRNLAGVASAAICLAEY